MAKFAKAVLFWVCLTSIGCGLDCVDKKTGLPRSSPTLAFSKKNKVFKFEMQSDKIYYKLDSGNVFAIKNVWVEDSWRYECIDNHAVIERDSALRLVIEAEYNADVYKTDYWLMRLPPVQNTASGSHLGSRLDFAYNGQDTFYLKLTKESFLEYTKVEESIDTLRFIKKRI